MVQRWAFPLHIILTTACPRSWASFLDFPWRCHNGFHPKLLGLLPLGRCVLVHRPRSHLLHSPAPRTARVAPGCRAGTQGSSGQLQRLRRGLHRCPRLCPAPAEHCPAAGYHRVLSREPPPPGWSQMPGLRQSLVRIRSKWRWNLPTPETMGAREKAWEVRDPNTGLLLHSTSPRCHRVPSILPSTEQE